MPSIKQRPQRATRMSRAAIKALMEMADRWSRRLDVIEAEMEAMLAEARRRIAAAEKRP